MPPDALQHFEGPDWSAQTPEGWTILHFAPRNADGIFDYTMKADGGPTRHYAVRLVRNEEGAELLYTMFRQPGMSEERFASDADWMMSELLVRKALLEDG